MAASDQTGGGRWTRTYHWTRGHRPKGTSIPGGDGHTAEQQLLPSSFRLSPEHGTQHVLHFLKEEEAASGQGQVRATAPQTNGDTREMGFGEEGADVPPPRYIQQ